MFSTLDPCLLKCLALGQVLVLRGSNRGLLWDDMHVAVLSLPRSPSLDLEDRRASAVMLSTFPVRFLGISKDMHVV